MAKPNFLFYSKHHLIRLFLAFGCRLYCQYFGNGPKYPNQAVSIEHLTTNLFHLCVLALVLLDEYSKSGAVLYRKLASVI